MVGIDLTFDQISAAMTSFWSIPVVPVIVSSTIAVGLVVIVVNALQDIFSGW